MLMIGTLFQTQQLVGRQAELAQISQIFTADGDLMVAGVSGSGRRALIREAARQVGARVLEIDCLRATHASRFLKLLAEGLLDVFSSPTEIGLIQRWSTQHPLILEQTSSRQARLVWHVPARDEWIILQALLTLPQVMADWTDCRVVFVFQNFPHIRSWDRTGKWEDYLRQEIQRQTRVNYVVMATVPEAWADSSHLQTMTLAPLDRSAVEAWVVEAMASEGLKFEADALDLFLDSVQGHTGDAIVLARRLWQTCRPLDGAGLPPTQPAIGLIQPHQLHRCILALVEDLSLTFESMVLLLPPIQARVLESLAIDPTDSPHSRDYLQKHQLSRGGGLQGALTGLEQKGLIYGARQGYRVAMPLLAFWLKHRIA